MAGALPAVSSPKQSQFCFLEMIPFPWSPLKDAFNFFFFYFFHLKYLFILFILLLLLFLPRRNRERKKEKKIKASKAITKREAPGSKPVDSDRGSGANKLGAFLQEKWRRTEPPRSERRALLPHLSPPSLHLGRVLSLCSLPLPTPIQPVCSKSRFWLERPASTFATPGTLQLQARALRVLTLPLLAAFKFIMPFIACYCMCYSHCPGDGSGSSGRGTRCGFH